MILLPFVRYSEVTHRYFRLIELLNQQYETTSDGPDGVTNGANVHLKSCDFALVVDDDAYINLKAWKEYFSGGWLNPEDVWYMGPFTSHRIDRGMFGFAHGTTIVLSKGLIREVL